MLLPVFMLDGLFTTTHVRFGLLIFLILLLDNLFMLDFEPLFISGCNCTSSAIIHLRHVEYFEHGEEIEVTHVETFEDDLGDDKIGVLLL